MINQPQLQAEASRSDQLSALVDGRLAGDDFAIALNHLETDDGALAQWHAYHVIGDVLRSPDLADAGGDMAFLRRLETRLADEPAPTLAPSEHAVSHPAFPVRTAANNDVFRWKMAAGFASLAAVAAIGWQSLQLQGSGQVGSASTLAQAADANTQANGLQQVRVGMAPGTAIARASFGNPPVMLRNAQLDELLSAHNRAVGGAALQSQVRLLRNVSVTEDFSR